MKNHVKKSFINKYIYYFPYKPHSTMIKEQKWHKKNPPINIHSQKNLRLRHFFLEKADQQDRGEGAKK